MKIWNIKNDEERTHALFLCKTLIEKKALIPVVGAGFSFDTPTDHSGCIPNVRDFRKQLLNYIEKYSGYSGEEIEEIESSNLSNIAETFWSIFERIPEDSLRTFFSFIKTNFTGISFFKGFQEAFLKVYWPYLFTLNYDSLIEDYSRNYYPLIPFDSINQRFFVEKTRLYKIHGDAKKYVDTGDKKYLILSPDQYVRSMMDPSNEDMLHELQTAFASKSILFFGCGLTGELDLLYSSQLAISEKIKNIDADRQAIIYISFEHDADESSDISLRTKDRLAKYGVTHVLRIFSEDQSEKFFNELAEFSCRLSQPGIDGFLEKFSAMKYHCLETVDTRSRDFMFQENLVWDGFEQHIITLPNYSVTRSRMEEVIEYVSTGSPICFISGNYHSGKTFLLLEISKHFATKKVYIFPSGTNLTEEQLNVLLRKENSLFCFDSKTLSTAQIKRMSNEVELERIKANHSCAVIVIDATDAPMYKYIFEARNLAREFPQTRISGIFNETEEPIFNQKIGEISLPPYMQGETLLDYIVRNEKELIMVSDVANQFLVPHKNLLARNAKGRIKALIMLATEIRISAKRAIQFGIDEHINDIIRCCQEARGNSVIEKDYSVYCGDSSGYEFVCNSKYWVIRALSIYAATKTDSADAIADAYYSIVKNYRNIYVEDNVKFYQKSEPYYFFDHIQLLFNSRWFSNSSRLMSTIYDRLLPLLSDSYQFLHQKAKGKLVIARVQLKYSRFPEGKETLEDALLNIIRAIRLAEKVPNAKNIAETLLHMVYTKGRILIEYSCVSLKYVPQAVDTCDQLYQMQQNVKHDAYNFATGTGEDKKSFENFKRILISNESILRFEDLDIGKVELLLTRWTGKHFRITKKRKRK